MVTKEEVEWAIRDWLDALLSRDFDRLWAYECESVGFGYRTRDARPMASLGREQHRAITTAFLDAMEHYRFDFESIETEVHGDIGIAWGTYIEEFQQKKGGPERAHSRFSQVMRKDDSGWKILLFHRDIQPFGEDGRYPGALTAV